MEVRYAKRVNSIKPSAIRELTSTIQQPGVISFAGGWPSPELFPLKEIEAITSKIISENGKAALQYGPTEGYVGLRELISKRMNNLGIDSTPGDVLVTSGSQQGIEFSGKLFIDEGDIVICESPSYLGALNAFNSYVPNFVEVSMDEDGMIMEELEESLIENPNAKFIYTVPDFQNPTGISMSIDRRKKIIELAEKYNVLIIEDNPYGELRFEGEMIPPIKHFDKNGVVIYLGSFSKIFCPGFRVGWICANEEILRKYNLIKQSSDLQANTLSQMIIAEFDKEVGFDSHVAKLIDVYKKKRDVMLETMKEYFPSNIKYTHPNGGLFTWVTLPEELDAKDVFYKAIERKAAFVPGVSFFPSGKPKNYFRLNYATASEEQIKEGIENLGKVLQEI